MATTHRLNLMPHLGYLWLDQGAKKGLHSYHPEPCWCRTRIPCVCDCTIDRTRTASILLIELFQQYAVVAGTLKQFRKNQQLKKNNPIK